MSKQLQENAFHTAFEHINFNNIRAYMVLTNWHWHGQEPNKQPEINDLEATVHSLYAACCRSMRENPEQTYARSSTGGFIVSITHWPSGGKEVDITFTLEHYSSSF